MSNVIAYIIFVSYNRNEYELKEIDLDKMSIDEFIEFDKNDEIDCKSITIRSIYDFAHVVSGRSEKFDDSVYWIVSKKFANYMGDISNFIEKYK